MLDTELKLPETLVLHEKAMRKAFMVDQYRISPIYYLVHFFSLFLSTLLMHETVTDVFHLPGFELWQEFHCAFKCVFQTPCYWLKE